MPPARRRPPGQAAPRQAPRPPLGAALARRPARRSSSATSTSSGSALVATAVFFAFVIYLGWDGGQAGDGAVEGLRFARRRRPLPRPRRADGGRRDPRAAARAARRAARSRPARVCLFAALSLGLAAGTLGLGPAAARSLGARVGQAARRRVGEGLYWAHLDAARRPSARTRRDLPLHAAVLLLTGASSPASSRPPATRSPPPPTREVRTRRAHGGRRAAHAARGAGRARAGPAAARRAPTLSGATLPEPTTRALPRRARRRRGPSSRRAERSEPDASRSPRRATSRASPRTPRPTSPASRAARRREPEELTPQGRYRALGDRRRPTSCGRVPDPRFLKRSSAEASRPDTAGQEKVAAQLIEALGHFGVEARVIGMVAGPHITRYELRLAPGHQGRQGRPAQGRPRLRAGRLGHPHPRADPGQAGRRRRGPQRAPPDRPPRRRAAGRRPTAGRR